MADRTDRVPSEMPPPGATVLGAADRDVDLLFANGDPPHLARIVVLARDGGTGSIPGRYAPRMPPAAPLRTVLFATLALGAFAGNSLLCRAALGQGAIGPAAFSAVRIAAGALALTLLVALRTRALPRRVPGSSLGAAMLFLYAVGFSYAYVELAAGTGALILFGFVQLTMTGWALHREERPHVTEWLGVALAIAGLVWLVLPGLQAPSPVGAGLMAVAGVSWGVYSLLGRGSAEPLADTTGNFVRALVPTIVAGTVGVVADASSASLRGVLLAATSGAVTSGLGYALWYAVLPALTRTRAALLQLVVPVLAAVAGVLLLGEEVAARLVIAMLLVLGGVGMAIAGRR